MQAGLIRIYEETDQATLVELLDLNTPAAFSPEEREEYVAFLQKRTAHYFVYLLNEKIIGAGGLDIFADTGSARIAWDMVHPSHHGQGVGSRLLQHRLALASERKLHTVDVRTSQMAYPFYAKAGFVLTETKENFWAEGYHLYHMILKLS